MNVNAKFAWASLLTFGLGVFLSFYVDTDLLQVNSPSTDNKIQELIALDNQQLFWLILKNNLGVIIISIAGGLTFGIISFINTMYNGYILGVFVAHTIKLFSLSFLLSSIAPHSIELAGIVLSCYIGYVTASFYFEYCFMDIAPKLASVKQILLLILICFLIITLAAFLETYVTIGLH